MALNYDSPLIDNTAGSPTLDSLKSGSDKINGALTEIKEEVNDLGSASLVDYEEGTWTPTLRNGGTATKTQQHLYTKVGNTVTVTGYVAFSGVPNNSATFQIAGLPFNTPGTYQAGSIGYVGSANIPDWLLILSDNSDYFYFHVSSGQTQKRTNSDVVAAGFTQMIFSCTYTTNS